MHKKYLLVLFIACGLSVSLFGQGSPDADTTTLVKKESKRVNNTEPVEKIVVPNLEPKPIVLKAINATMSKGENPGIQMDIPEVSVDDIQRDLEKSIKNKTKSKFVKTGSETSIENTVIKEIGDDPVNVYVQVTSLDSGARVTVFVEDQNKFINEDSDKYNRMSSFIRDFGVKAYHEKEAGHIKTENKILSDLEGDLNKLRKQNEKMYSDISENESTITNSEVDIKSNTKQQELKDDEIIKQKTVVNSTTDKDAKKLENKKLHDLEKEKDKFRNEVSSLNKKIVKSRSSIETLEAEIKLNLQEQDLLQDKITSQRGFLKGLEGKLEKIK